jgi:hypothetical protein
VGFLKFLFCDIVFQFFDIVFQFFDNLWNVFSICVQEGLDSGVLSYSLVCACCDNRKMGQKINF